MIYGVCRVGLKMAEELASHVKDSIDEKETKLRREYEEKLRRSVCVCVCVCVCFGIHSGIHSFVGICCAMLTSICHDNNSKAINHAPR